MASTTSRPSEPQRYVSYMSLAQFEDEPARRLGLDRIREAAAMSGYRGRVELAHEGIHGRTRGIIRVTVYPRSSP